MKFINLVIAATMFSNLAIAGNLQVSEGQYKNIGMHNRDEVVNVSVKKDHNGKSHLVLKFEGSKDLDTFPLTTDSCVKQKLIQTNTLLYTEGIKFTTCLTEKEEGTLIGSRKFETYTKILGVKAQLGEIEEYSSESPYEMQISEDEILVKYENSYYLKSLHLVKIK